MDMRDLTSTLRILNNIDYLEWLKITNFNDDDYAQDKFIAFVQNMAEELMNYDGVLLEKFEQFLLGN